MMGGIGIVIACLLVPAMGWPIIRLIDPKHARGPLGAALALLVGLGAASWVYTPLRFAGLASPLALVTAEIALAGAAWLIFWRVRRGTTPEPLSASRSLEPVTVALGLAAATLAAMAGTIWWRLRTHEADGGFDALAGWNYRARFMFRVDDLAPAFSPLTGHPDYPLQLPTTIARVYAYAGSDPNAIPQAVGLAYGLLAIALVACGLARLRSLGAALLGVALLLSLRGFIFLTANHYADVPLSCAFVAMVILLVLAAREGRGRAHVGGAALAGLCAGIGAWTKNEGQLFALVGLAITLLLVGAAWRDRAKAAGAFVLGLLPSVVCLSLFKALYPSVVDLAEGGVGALLPRLFDPTRHAAVWATLRQQWFLWIDPMQLILIALMAATAGWNRATIRTALPGAIALALILCGYYAVYVTTPVQQAGHIYGSASRLLAQLWPTGVVTLLVFLRTPEELTYTWREGSTRD